MAIGLSDIKILWGRAGGRCSNPGCRVDLTKAIEGGPRFHIGEMAHMIAHSPDGPRGQPEGGEDTYENHVLLCPSCHTSIDKAPDGYPEGTLRSWKAGREAEVEKAGSELKFDEFDHLRRHVGTLLAQNGAIFESVGPKSNIADADPGSDAVSLWEARKLDTILPNNRMILNSLEANAAIVPDAYWGAIAKFKEHALAYADQQFGRTDFYPSFPLEFGELFRL